MSARQSPVERDARRLAVIHLQVDREGGDKSALEVFDASVSSLAEEAAGAVLAGDMRRARRAARAWQLVRDSRARLRARRRRDYDAVLAARAEAHGLKTGEDVRVTRAGSSAGPVGTVFTIEDVSGDLLWVTVDGERCIAWVADVERAEALPVIGDTVALSDGSTARVLARYDAGAAPEIANKWQVTGPYGARVIGLDEIVGYPNTVPA